jgi:hypothetical protein
MTASQFDITSQSWYCFGVYAAQQQPKIIFDPPCFYWCAHFWLYTSCGNPSCFAVPGQEYSETMWRGVPGMGSFGNKVMSGKHHFGVQAAPKFSTRWTIVSVPQVRGSYRWPAFPRIT